MSYKRKTTDGPAAVEMPEHYRAPLLSEQQQVNAIHNNGGSGNKTSLFNVILIIMVTISLLLSIAALSISVYALSSSDSDSSSSHSSSSSSSTHSSGTASNSGDIDVSDSVLPTSAPSHGQITQLSSAPTATPIAHAPTIISSAPSSKPRPSTVSSLTPSSRPTASPTESSTEQDILGSITTTDDTTGIDNDGINPTSTMLTSTSISSTDSSVETSQTTYGVETTLMTTIGNNEDEEEESWSVGDYKISAQTSSHGNWLLCDGSNANSTKYPDLYELLTGNSIEGNYNQLFTLPNPRDQVLGIIGSSYSTIGENYGSESVTLSESNLPSHNHYVVNSDECSTSTPSELNTDSSLSIIYAAGSSCSSYMSNDYLRYQLFGTSSTPIYGKTSSVGSGSSISVMQPTYFLGNVFIYSK